ncbi:hypothetical protein BC834DRAFT_880322 [Gloeopeniophorella convolvens]|nr:hypothetical protein BC834DRAFT_880322 [Gloeopeniophorella convolvens]
MWSAEQKVRILRAVCGALPAPGALRALCGTLELGAGAWGEVFGAYAGVRHVRVGSAATLQALVEFVGRGGHAGMVSLTLCDIDFAAKGRECVGLLGTMHACRPPGLARIYVDGCRCHRRVVEVVQATVPGVEVVWDGVEVPTRFREMMEGPGRIA